MGFAASTGPLGHALDPRPALADAIAAFDCLAEEVIERHSHAIILGAVVSLKEGADEPVLIRRRGEYATLV